MGRVLLISGSTGMAAATAKLARERGDTPVLMGWEETADWVVDLRDEKAVEAAVDGCLERHGRIDGLFNVVGISGRRYGDGPLHEATLEGWQARNRERDTFCTPVRARVWLVWLRSMRIMTW